MEPRALISRILETSTRTGARAAEVLFQKRHSLSLDWSHAGVEAPHEGEREVLHGRVYLQDGRTGTFTVDHSSSSPAILKTCADALSGALQRAEAAPADPLAAPAERFDLDQRGFGLMDRRLVGIGMADRREILEQNSQGCRRAHPEIHVEGLHYSETREHRVFGSTRGILASEDSTSFRASCRARYGDGGRSQELCISSRQFTNLASIPFGVELGRRLAFHSKPVPVPDADLPLVLSPHVVAHLLSSLAPAFSAPAVLSGTSFLASTMGKPLTHRSLHVIDDPSLPGALLTRVFDDRGIPPSPVILLKEGVAANLLLDLVSARQLDLPATGHELGGEVNASNLVLRPGSRSRNAMGMDMGDYLVLDALHDPHPLDLATGRLDTRGDVLVFRNNEPFGLVEGIPLRMHISSLLAEVLELTSDQLRIGAVDACSVALGGVSLQGS